MKRKKFFVYAGLILAAVCMPVLSGCPQDPGEDEGVDARLVSSWTNNPKGEYNAENGLTGLEKTFTINEDSTFTAYINVIFLSACQGAKVDFTKLTEQTIMQTIAGIVSGLTSGDEVTDIDDLRWKVTGKLTKTDDETYLMAGLKAEGKAGPKFTLGEQPIDLSTVTPAIVGFFGKEPVKLHVEDDNTFTFSSASSNQETAAQVTAFFGGTYTKNKAK